MMDKQGCDLLVAVAIHRNLQRMAYGALLWFS
jgi:hypothetical protein